MNVTKNNFLEAIPLIAEHVKTATYMSVDFEMTGLYLPEDVQYSTDSVEERYTKMRAGIERGLRTLQLGLTLSHYDPISQTITHTPYNVYTWPTTTNLFDSSIPLGNPSILLDCESIEFNRQHGMDFNEWVRSGVPVLQREDTLKTDQSHQKVLARESSYMLNYDIYEHKYALGKAMPSKQASNYESIIIQKYTSLSLIWVADQLLEKNIFTQDQYDQCVETGLNSNVYPRRGRRPFNKGRKFNKNRTSAQPTPPSENPVMTPVETPSETNIETLSEPIAPLPEPVTSWTATINFEAADDTLDSRNTINVETELNLWKLCRSHHLVARVVPYVNPETKKKGITLTLYTHDQYQLYLDQFKANCLAKLNQMYGASYIWQLITNSPNKNQKNNGQDTNPDNQQSFGANCPLIVHNGFFDLMFLYNHCEGPLPPTFSAFADELVKFFPSGIYDTKYLFGHPQTQTLKGFENTKGITNSLGGLYNWFTKQQIKQQERVLAAETVNETIVPLALSAEGNVPPQSDIAVSSADTPTVDIVDTSVVDTSIVIVDVEAEPNTVIGIDATPLTRDTTTPEDKQPQDTAATVAILSDETQAIESTRVTIPGRIPPTPKKHRFKKTETASTFPTLYIKHQFREGFDAYSSNEDRCHEAGYDSWITSVLFGHLLIFISSDVRFQSQLPGYSVPSPVTVVDSTDGEASSVSTNPLPQINDNIINVILGSKFFQDVYLFHTNSFGQYCAFNFGFRRHPSQIANNYFVFGNDALTPAQARADSFIITFKMAQLQKRLIEKGLLEPPSQTEYVSISGCYPSDLSRALFDHFFLYLERLGLVTDSSSRDSIPGKPVVDMIKQPHLPFDRSDKSSVFFCKITHHRLLLSTFESCQVNDLQCKSGNLMTTSEFTTHLITAFQTAIAPHQKTGKDSEPESRPINFLNYILPSDLEVVPYTEFLALRDAEELYKNNQVTPESLQQYPFTVISKDQHRKIINDLKVDLPPSSSLDFITGTLFGFGAAAIAAAAALFFIPSSNKK